MRVYRIACFLILILLQGSLAFAMDWKSIHEKADTIDEATALNIVAQDSKKPEALYLLGLVYLNQYKTLAAQKVFESILKSDSQSLEAKWGMAEIDRRMRKTQESKTLLEEILKQAPDFAPAQVSLAYIEYIQFNFKQTVQLAAQVLQAGRDKVDLSNLVRAYGLYAGAKGMIAYYGGPLSKVINGTFVLSTLRKAEKLDPQAPGVLFGLGSYYLLAPPFLGRDLNAAEKYLKAGIARDPKFPDIYVRLAQVYQLQGNEKTYLTYLNKALEIDPQNELALDIKTGTCKFICVSQH